MFNVSKCKVVHLRNHNPGNSCTLNGTALEEASEEMDLGIIVDSQLRFHQQTAAATYQASQMLAIVKLSFANIDAFTLPLFCKAMVRPFLKYRNVIWGSFGKTDQKCPKTSYQNGGTSPKTSYRNGGNSGTPPVTKYLCRLGLPLPLGPSATAVVAET